MCFRHRRTPTFSVPPCSRISVFPAPRAAPAAPGSSITIPTATGPLTYKSATTQNSFGLGVDASYQVDFWGLARDNLRAAQETLKSTRYAQQVVALTTVSSVANAYLDVLALREEIALTQQNADAARRILTVTQAKKTNGISSELDVAEQEATVHGLEAQIPPLREQEREATFALAILLGKPPEGFQVTAKNLDGIKAPAVAPGIPSALLERRPDVAEAEANLASAHANVDAARAAFFPQIGLTGSGGFASSAIGTIINASSLEWSVGASLAQTIFDGGKLFAESDLAKAEQRGLIATYRKTVLTAFSNVETSLGQVSNFGEEQDALDKEVKAAAEAFRISELQYREGIVDITSVLQTEQTLFTAENLLVQSKLARAQADVSLFESLGGGWAENPDDKTQVTAPTAAPAKT
jgi:multidrug efflux system outer membrane protein